MVCSFAGTRDVRPLRKHEGPLAGGKGASGAQADSPPESPAKRSMPNDGGNPQGGDSRVRREACKT
jgi:hypothetical protein